MRNINLSQRDNNSPGASLSESSIFLCLWRCRPCRTGHCGDSTPNGLLVMLLSRLLPARARARVQARWPLLLLCCLTSRSWRNGTGRTATPFGLGCAGCRFCGARCGRTAASPAHLLSKNEQYVSALGRAGGDKWELQ